jgi:hypothetical protein
VNQDELAKLLIILSAALVAGLVSFVLTPLAIRLAPRLGAVDHPD